MVGLSLRLAIRFHHLVERIGRDSTVARIAPVSRKMILNFVAERVLGLPQSY
jgi:acyl-CoA dehydrogenase